jgi:hypothetical protein
MALEGDVQAMRLCLDRIAPPRRGGLVRLALPEVTTPAGVGAAVAEVVAQVAAGRISVDEAAALGSLLSVQGKVLELTTIEARLRALEERVK